MEYISLIGGIIGALANIPLLVGIWKNKIIQSFSTWVLWASLDIIATASIIAQNGNFWLPLGYSIGATTVALILVIKKQFSWTRFETFVLFLVLICLLVWSQTDSRSATISSVTALFIASLPQVKETFKFPKNTPTGIYLVFCLANTLSLFGSDSWTVENKLYSFSALVICLILTLLSIRKKT